MKIPYVLDGGDGHGNVGKQLPVMDGPGVFLELNGPPGLLHLLSELNRVAGNKLTRAVLREGAGREIISNSNKRRRPRGVISMYEKAKKKNQNKRGGGGWGRTEISIDKKTEGAISREKNQNKRGGGGEPLVSNNWTSDGKRAARRRRE